MGLDCLKFVLDKGATLIDPFWANTVMAGCAEIDDIVFLSSSLEENGIARLQEIKGAFHAYDNENWGTSHYVDQVLSYMVK